MECTVIVKKLSLTLRCDVLVTEEDYTSMGDQKGELILLSIRELTQLDSTQLSSETV